MLLSTTRVFRSLFSLLAPGSFASYQTRASVIIDNVDAMFSAIPFGFFRPIWHLSISHFESGSHLVQERHVGFTGDIDSSPEGPRDKPEKEEEGGALKLHRRDTPHHLKNKRITHQQGAKGAAVKEADLIDKVGLLAIVLVSFRWLVA